MYMYTQICMLVMYVRICEYLFIYTSNFICMYICENKLIKAPLNKGPSQISAQGLASAKN